MNEYPSSIHYDNLPELWECVFFPLECFPAFNLISQEHSWHLSLKVLVLVKWRSKLLKRLHPRPSVSIYVTLRGESHSSNETESLGEASKLARYSASAARILKVITVFGLIAKVVITSFSVIISIFFSLVIRTISNPSGGLRSIQTTRSPEECHKRIVRIPPHI